jgi:ADP-ribose pyrophosphatase YjhB (NUDIX family)
MKRTCLLILAATVFLSSAIAEPPAGMVIYTKSGGEVYLLLAEHARGERGWAGFGGGARAGETVAETAAHKGEEESKGYFNRADLLEKIKDQKPAMDGEFASYFVEVDFVPAQRVMNNPPPQDDDAYGERSNYAWIPYSAVAGHLKEDIDRAKTYEIDPLYLPASTKVTTFWRAWLSNMRKAAAANVLPW